MGMEPQRVGFESTNTNIDKVPYIPLQKITKEMGTAEKKGAELWNVMVNWIRSRGGMEDKD